MASHRSANPQLRVAQTAELPQPAPRERILAAARDLFYRNGINAVGVEAIAAAASTNKMTLYRHFRSKDDLIVAYVTEIAREGDAFWQDLKAKHPDAPDKFLNAWVDYVEDVLGNKYSRGCALANAAVELPADHPARAVIKDYKERKRGLLIQLFRAARYREPEQLADEVFLLFEGARINLQCGGRIPASKIVRMLRNVLMTSPRARRPGKA